MCINFWAKTLNSPYWDGQIKIGRDLVATFNLGFYITRTYLIPNTFMNSALEQPLETKHA